ncbi:MAG: tyrosine-type recombinase/integrase [Phycisphaerales bacterium]|nr:tyrosine-type recombinase/integrase [Phycisphaerales bacterium]MCB9857019.1 tyrosine-type recombinase/integrase [Phycisphaerales bacterium]MCB9861854.1 tyrosine-type recombinase/integrase [Phycisphaerales bacterium]
MPWTLDAQMFLRLDEANRLLKAVRAEGTESEIPDPTRIVDQLIIECLIFSGLQSSEFCRLNVVDTFIGTGRSSLLVVGKRGRRREVFVPERVSELIQLYVEKIRPRYLPVDWASDDVRKALLLNERHRPLTRPTLYRRVLNILDRHGFGDRGSIQLLRHTYGYLAYLLTGSNLLFVQRQLGHAHPMVTAVYAQFVEEDYAAIADGLVAGIDARINR